jgi:hypothetical protein
MSAPRACVSGNNAKAHKSLLCGSGDEPGKRRTAYHDVLENKGTYPHRGKNPQRAKQLNLKWLSNSWVGQRAEKGKLKMKVNATMLLKTRVEKMSLFPLPRCS